MFDYLKSIKKENRPFIILLAAALAVHLFLPLKWSDDALLMLWSSNADLSHFLIGSSRVLPGILIYYFARINILWRLANPVVLTMLAVTISKLIPCKDERLKNTVICIAVIYPAMFLVDAGFIATTLNYLWPVTFGLVALLPLQKVLKGKRLRWYECLACIPLVIYANSLQQMCAVLTAIFFAACLYLLFKKKLHPYIILQLLLCITCFIYAYKLSAIGEHSRLARDIVRYFPDFASLSILNKSELGFSSTFYCMTMEIRSAAVAFWAFSLFLATAVFRKTKRMPSRIVSAFPFVFSVLFGVANLIDYKYVPFLKYLTGNMVHYRMHLATYSFQPVPDILFLCVCASIVFSLCVLLENIQRIISALAVLSLGLASRLVMGFSPSVWASGYRTFFILFIAFIFCSIMVLDKNIGLFKKPKHD